MQISHCFKELVKSAQTTDMPIKITIFKKLIKALMDSLRHNFFDHSPLWHSLRRLGNRDPLVFFQPFATHSKKYVLCCYPIHTLVTETEVRENNI